MVCLTLGDYNYLPGSFAKAADRFIRLQARFSNAITTTYHFLRRKVAFDMVITFYRQNDIVFFDRAANCGLSYIPTPDGDPSRFGRR